LPPVPGRGRSRALRDAPPLPARTAANPPPRAPRVPRSRRGNTAGPRRVAPPAGPRPRRLRPGRFIALILLLAVIGAVVAFALSLFQPFHGKGHGRVVVRVPNGATTDDIGTLLADRGVVAHGFFFSLRAAIDGKRNKFQAGTFTLAHDMSYADAIKALTAKPGQAPTFSVTIPEGRSRRESAPLLKQAGVTGSYLAATRSSTALDPRRYGAPRGTSSLEGFLFPATYQLRRDDATAKALVAQQLAAFKSNFAKLNLTYARHRHLTPYDVVIIASMIEREAQVERDRPLISAVIYNRLRDHMPLGIDATLRYALNDWTHPLRVSQLDSKSPYNTGKRLGLPPTPIGNPGLASLRAAVAPAHVSYLYYVVKPCGNGAHAFSSTAAQFERDVSRYNAARARNHGNSPAKC